MKGRLRNRHRLINPYTNNVRGWKVKNLFLLNFSKLLCRLNCTGLFETFLVEDRLYGDVTKPFCKFSVFVDTSNENIIMSSFKSSGHLLTLQTQLHDIYLMTFNYLCSFETFYM